MKQYKVTYKAKNGKVCSFKFNSDRSFRQYGAEHQSSIGGLGAPFCNDLFAKVREIESREDSAMKRNGGFHYWNIKKIECLDTKQVKYFV